MRATTRGARRLRVAVILFLLLAVALVLRVASLGMPGHASDVAVIAQWAEALAANGPEHFYDAHRSVYPALLFMYWPLGVVFDGDALHLAIKASSIPFDMALGILLFVVVRGVAGSAAGLAAATIYLLNPAVLIDGPIWGQIDAAGTLVFLGALLALARPQYTTAGALAVLAGLIKPQFGLVVLPVAWVAISDWRSKGDLGPLWRTAIGGAAVFALVSLPLALSPGRYLDGLRFIAADQRSASLYAPNTWGLLFGYTASDAGLKVIGAILLLVGLSLALLPLLRARDLPTLLAVGTVVVFAFYFLPTRVHERYLFPALGLLAPFAAVSRRSLAVYVCLSLAFAASLLYQLGTTSPAAVPPALRAVLLTPASVWVQGIVLATSAVAAIRLMLSGAGERLRARS